MQTKTCFVCEGTGSEELFGEYPGPQFTTCSNCGGSGKIEVAVEKPEEILALRSSPEVAQALLALCPYANPEDDPDKDRGQAALILRKALGL